MSERLLPTSASELEFSVDETVEDRVDGVCAPLKEALDPRASPIAFLPFLAFGRDVALWSDRWSEHVRRDAVANEYRLKRVAGTPAGIRARLAQLPRARLVDIVRPPQGFFAGAPYAENAREWAAWTATLPLLKIFPRRESAAETSGGYATGADAPDSRLGPEAFLGAESGEATWFAGAPPEEPWEAALVDGDVETALAVRVLPDPRLGHDGDMFEISGRAPAADGLFADDFWDGACADGARRPLYRRIAVETGAAARRRVESLVGQSERVQDAPPLIVGGDRRGLGVFAGDAFEGSFVDADDLTEQILTWRLIDGPARAFGGAAFVDHDRFGLPDHTAELVVELSAGPCRDAFFADADCADAGFAGAPFEAGALDALCEAVDAARAEHEDLLVDLHARRGLYRAARSIAELNL